MNKTKFRSIFGGLAMASLVFAMSCANPSSDDSGKTPEQKQKVANVKFTLADGTEVKSGETKEVTSGTKITLSCGTDGADIRYILGDAKEAKYAAPIEITKATTIKAFAEKEGWDKSDTTEAKFTIKAEGGGGDEPVTPPETPAAVTNFAAENGGAKLVKLTWTPVEGVTAYDIAVKDAAGTAVKGAVVGGVTDTQEKDKKTATVTGLGEGVSYNFVITYKKDGKTSTEAKATAVTKPAAVTGVNANLNDKSSWDSVDLKWTITDGTNTADNITYEVTPKTTATGAATGTAVINEDKKGATVSGLTANTAYTFTVTAKIGEGETAIKTESAASGSVTTEATPSKLVKLTANGDPVVASKSVTLNWKVENTGSCNVTGFEVYKNGAKLNEGSPLASGATSYTFTGLKPNTKYTLKVVPVAKGASTTPYEVKDVCTKVANVTVVSSALKEGTSTAELKWTDSENALPVSYIITTYKNSGTTAVEGLGKTVESTDKKITSAEIDFSKAEAGTYTFKIQVKGQGTDNTNTAQDFTGNVVIEAPKKTIGDVTGFAVTEGTAKNSKAITLKWTPPATGEGKEAAAKYNITCNQNVTFANSETNANTDYTVTGATTVDVKGMEAGKKYTFTIKAVGASGAVSSGNVTCEWTPAYTATVDSGVDMHGYKLPASVKDNTIIVPVATASETTTISGATLKLTVPTTPKYDFVEWQWKKDGESVGWAKFTPGSTVVNADITLKPMFKSNASAIYAELAGVGAGFTDDHSDYPATYKFEASGDGGKTAAYKMGSKNVTEKFAYTYKLIPETETTGTLSVFSEDGFHVGIQKPVTGGANQTAITTGGDLDNTTPAKVKIVFNYVIERNADTKAITNIKLTTTNVCTGNGVGFNTDVTKDVSTAENEVYVIGAAAEEGGTVKIDWSEFGVANINGGCAFTLKPAE